MPARRKQILILDNDESVLITLQRVLENEGFDTTTSWDVAEALELLRSRDFDLVLVGDHPPELNGARVLEILREAAVSAPCLVLQSAARHPFEGAYFRFLGASGMISKWRPREIAEHIKSCLGASEDEGPPARRAA